MAADGIFWRLILWRAKGGAPGVWTVRWDEQALSFAPAASTASATAPPTDAPPATGHPRGLSQPH